MEEGDGRKKGMGGRRGWEEAGMHRGMDEGKIERGRGSKKEIMEEGGEI